MCCLASLVGPYTSISLSTASPSGEDMVFLSCASGGVEDGENGWRAMTSMNQVDHGGLLCMTKCIQEGCH